MSESHVRRPAFLNMVRQDELTSTEQMCTQTMLIRPPAQNDPTKETMWQPSLLVRVLLFKHSVLAC